MSFGGLIRYAWKTIRGGARMLKPGDLAPDFNTTDETGKPLRLRDFRGKKVVLWFYPKANTPG